MRFDSSPLLPLLVAATREAFAELRANHPDETFYGFTLLTSPERHWLSPLAFGAEGLAEATDGDDDNIAALRWSTGDSPYLEEVDAHFDAVNAWLAGLPDVHALAPAPRRERADAVFRTCVEALRVLDEEGFFGRGQARDAVALNVIMGDQSNRSRLEGAALLNPPAVMRRLETELAVTRQVGALAELGPVLPYVRAIATAGDVLAFCTGQHVFSRRGEGEVHERALQTPIWCLAATPTHILAGGDGELLHLPLDGGEPVREPRHQERIVGVAASRDGRTVVTTGWDERVVLTRDGVERWAMDRSADAVALDAEGRVVVTGGERVELFDAARGEALGTREAKRRRRFEHVAIAADGHVAAAVGKYGKHGLAVFAPTGQLIASRHIPAVLPESAREPGDNPRECTALAFSPSGARLASAHASGELHVWRTSSARRAQTVRARHQHANGCVWLDETRVALVGSDVDGSPAVAIFTV